MVVTPVGRQWKIIDFDTYVALPGSFVAFLVRSGDFLFSMYGVCPCVYVFLLWMTQAVVMRAVLKHQWRSEYHLLTLYTGSGSKTCDKNSLGYCGQASPR